VTTDNFDFQTRSVSFSQIDWADGTYRITYSRPCGPLVQSIAAIGLQQLPVLQEKESSGYCIVAGFRRLQALQKIKQGPILCKIASYQTEIKDLFLYNFFENIDRGFNTVEESLIVKKLSDLSGEDELLRRYLPLLNMPPRKETIERCIRINQISPAFWPALVQGRFFPETVETVVRDFFPVAHSIFALFISFRWGFQKQKEFLSELKEIGIRRYEKPEKIFSAIPIGELLQHSKWTPQQKGEALRKYFRTILYPLLTETKNHFEEMISLLNLDHRTRIVPPPYFEGGQYGLDIRFSNPKELKASLGRIHQVLENGELDGLP
jgi:hypothetical protein